MEGARSPVLVGLSVLGICIFGASVGFVAATSVDYLGMLLIALAVLAGWVRIELDPPSSLDLIPFVVFMTILLAGPPIALFAAVFSALVSSRFFAGNPWHVVATDVGEEGLATLAAVFVATGTQLTAEALPSTEGLLAFLQTAVVYSVLRLTLAAIRSNVAEGIGILSFARNAGKYMVGHLALLATFATIFALLYGKVGYLVPPLATIALIEFYIPGKLIGEQRNSLFANLAVIAQAIDLKDAYTGTHLRSVETIAVRTARAMRLSEADVRRIRIGALMHDIGKVGVSGRIIRKPAALDPTELAAMRRHPVIGAEIMQPVELLSDAAAIVRHHHEHYDGSGYPDGLKGEERRIGSRIIMVADAFHAIISDRPYRPRRPKDEALRELRRGAGSQFDPKVLQAFESVIETV